MKKIILENGADFQQVGGLSEDARYFISEGGNGVDQLKLVDSQTDTAQTIFTNSADGADGLNFFRYDAPVLSQDGRYVTYLTENSQQTSIVTPAVVTTAINVFDRTTGQSRVVYSYTDNGSSGAYAGIDSALLSPDGQSVFFSADIASLTGSPVNHSDFGQTDLFKLNLQTGAIQTLLQNVDGLEMFLSPGGKYLSIAADNASLDRLNGTLIDVATGNVDAVLPGEFIQSISADGRYAVFSTNDQVLSEDTNRNADVYLADLTTGQVQLISTSPTGVLGNDFSTIPQISADGSEVLFETAATNISPGATETIPHLVLWERATGYINYIADDPTNVHDYVLSADGHTIAFGTNQSLTAGDTDTTEDTYLIDISRPTLTIDPVNGSGFVNATDGPLATLSGMSDAAGQVITITFPGQQDTASAGTNNHWGTIVDVRNLADGTYNVHALVSDGLTATADLPFTVDRTPPAATIGTVAGDDIINAAELSHATVDGTVLVTNPAGPGSVVGTLVLSIDGGVFTSTFGSQAGSSSAAQGFSHDLNATGVADGEHTITLTVTDEAGNKTVITKDVLVDTTPPKIAITSVSGDDVVDRNELKTPQGVHGTSDAIGQTVNVLLDGAVVDQAVVQADGTWLSTVDFSSTVTGNHDITAEVSDEAGNPGRADAGVYVDTGFAVTQLSDGPDGEQGGGQGVMFPGLTADGTKLVFTGLNFDLESNATGSSGAQVFIKDLTTGAITYATPDPSENAEFGAISPDGRYVEFVTDANLDPINQAYAPGLYFTYTKDLNTGTIYFHSSTDDRYDGTNPDTFDPGITPGYYDQLADNIPIGKLPVFPLAIADGGTSLELIDDLEPNQVVPPLVMITQIRLDSPFIDGDGVPYFSSGAYAAPDASPPIENDAGRYILQEYAPQLSADGSVMAFEARFFPEQWDTSNPARPTITVGAATITQIYAGQSPPTDEQGNDPIQALASSFSDGTPMPFGAIDPALSADGKFVAFWSWGNDDKPEVFVKNLTTGELKIASSDALGNAGVNNASGTFNAGFNSIAISADGRFVAFTSDAKLTPDDSGTGADLYVKDMQTGAIQRLPLPAGTFANDLSTQLTMRADGQYIAFTTSAGLSAMDTNHTSDIYGISLASLETPPTISIDTVAGDDRINASELSNHLKISGTSDAIGGKVTLLIDGGAFPSVVVGADGTWSTTIDTNGLIEGAHQFRATVTDAAGATASDGDLVTVDTVAPTVVLSADTTHIADGQTATITATFSEGIGNLSSDFLVASSGTLTGGKFVDDHTYTATYTPAGLGAFTIKVNPDTVFDFAGNGNATGSTLTGSDEVPPQFQVNRFGPATVLGKAEIASPIAITGLADAAAGTVAVAIDGHEQPVAVVATDDSWSTTGDFSHLADGVHHLQVSVTNVDGFANTIEIPFTVDTVAPTVVLSSDTTHFAVGQPVIVTATFSEAVHLNGPSYFEVGTTVTVTNERFINDHSYSATITPAPGFGFVSGFEVVINPGQVSDAGINDNTDTVKLTIGRSFDGYIVGGTVGYDDGTGHINQSEPTATTGSQGDFALSGGTGPLVMTGGVDSSTGLAFTGTFETPDGGTALSSLTTLIEKVIEANPGNSVAQANAAVDSALGLPGGTDLTSLDAVAGAMAGDAASTAAFKAGSELLNVITLIQAANGAPDAAYAALAADVAAGHLDLTNVTTIESIAQSAGLDSAAAQAVASIASATDAALANQLAGATTPLQVFIDITGASIAEQGDASNALSHTSGDTGYQQVADSYLQSLAATLSHDDLTAAENVACYCPGTLIATDRGDVAVEDLRIGDGVIVMSGLTRTIKWIGTRSYAGRFILGRKDLLPICFKPGSLGEGLPRRDLWISPHHAMYLEGVLIEARDLVNGVSVVQAEGVDRVDYFHVELDSHDVIVAEGALSETFVDDNSRGMFHNAHEYGALYPDAERVAARYCAKRCADGYEVEAVRRDIDARAGLRSTGDETPVTLRGHVDAVSAGCISGWAQNPDHPEAPVCLDIFVGGRLIGQTLANRFRDDLARAGLGSGKHGFAFIPPAGFQFSPRSIEVRRSIDGARLAVSYGAEQMCGSVARKAA